MKIVVGELEHIYGTVETGPKGFVYTPARPASLPTLEAFAAGVPPGLKDATPEEVLEYLVEHRRGYVWCGKVPDSWKNGDKLP